MVPMVPVSPWSNFSQGGRGGRRWWGGRCGGFRGRGGAFEAQRYGACVKPKGWWNAQILWVPGLELWPRSFGSSVLFLFRSSLLASRNWWQMLHQETIASSSVTSRRRGSSSNRAWRHVFSLRISNFSAVLHCSPSSKVFFLKCFPQKQVNGRFALSSFRISTSL